MKEEKKAKVAAEKVYVRVCKFVDGGKTLEAKYDKLKKRHYYVLDDSLSDKAKDFIIRHSVKA